MNKSLLDQFGNIDIYLFDQILKGRFDSCKTVLDVGCGRGRNIIYFLKNQFEVFGIDRHPESISEVIKLSRQLAPGNPAVNFVVGEADAIPFRDDFFDLVICNALLHFAENKTHFEKMLHEIWRVLKPGGFLFVRLASDIGIENLVIDSGNEQYLLPDGSKRFLVDLEDLLHYTQELHATLAEPVKTTNVQNLRSMTTWCLLK